mmetsp:Transcript_8725/g.36099  ORF Transcript_8725/g.36099 Transcript_8725/m.36099 type:complete len:250 (-) Transcript_8725:12-761(-)|eukprot:CAMPEP_0185701652 /NCGR_PEP_ID=MMETSP1164-20130828/10048_1 /TAXON_ID=1104430 /ORGANISM="Chrysoreinhardia sp, Strain CCMP2950" /LENGTH=249 /DNA_ID=CAMNT_0028368745 /DNA_START=24 /DNA_END=773 /DNA_ORIENTATION=+
MAAEFAHIWTKRQASSNKRDFRQRLANGMYGQESECCTIIQAVWRGLCARGNLAANVHASIEVGRVHRGNLCRLRAFQEKSDRRTHEAAALLDVHATQLQRLFRAFYSRQYMQNFAARKAYLVSVLEQGTRLKTRLSHCHGLQVVAGLDEFAKNRHCTFARIVQDMHYLTSTKSISGIFYNTHAPSPKVMGVNLECHLSMGTKDLLRLRTFPQHHQTQFHVHAKEVQASSPIHTHRALQFCFGKESGSQ